MNAVSLESRAKLNTHRSFQQTSGCVSLVEGAAVIFQPPSPSRVTLKSRVKKTMKKKKKKLDSCVPANMAARASYHRHVTGSRC